MGFSSDFLKNCSKVISEINTGNIEKIVDELFKTRQKKGRLFCVGSGGGAGHASHAACDFRKLCNIESYSVYDNVSELTARVNDDGWDDTIKKWLKTSRINSNDCLFVFSVGGGSQEKNISNNLVRAVQYAKEVDATVVGVVGKDGGYTKQKGDAVVVIGTVDKDLITPITEGIQAVVWHLIVSHPKLQINTAKWESTP